MRLTERLRQQLKSYKRTPHNWEQLSIAAGAKVPRQTFDKLLSDAEEVRVNGETLERVYSLLLGGGIKFGKPKFPEPRPGRPPNATKV